MARYTGPKCKLARREGTDLFLKSGVKPLESKCKFQVPPGGIKGERKQRLSDYGLQLREKQKLRRMYGVLERQFRNYFESAVQEGGVTGLNLLRRLEFRLDNVVYRLGLASSRRQARQLVSHRHFEVNGRIVNVPSFQVKSGDEIKVRRGESTVIAFALEASRVRTVPSWLSFNEQEKSGKVLALPERDEMEQGVEEHLIVEFYSR